MNKPLITLGFLVAALNAHAAEESIAESKDWIWTLSPTAEDVYYAGTTNKARNIIGVYCDGQAAGGACIYRADLGASCTKGQSYNAMLNAAVGSAPVTLTCDDNNILSIAPFDTINDAIRSKGLLSIAIPQADGSFTVSRFSLAGSTATIIGMRTAARQRAPTAQADFVRL